MVSAASTFTLPTTDVDGNMIDPEHVSYSVYVDNGNGPEVFTFDAATYSHDLTEDITAVPYSSTMAVMTSKMVMFTSIAPTLRASIPCSPRTSVSRLTTPLTA